MFLYVLVLVHVYTSWRYSSPTTRVGAFYHRTGKPPGYLDIDFFLPYEKHLTQVTLWHGSTQNNKGIARNHLPDLFSWIVPLVEFKQRYGEQELMPSAATTVEFLFAKIDNLFPHLQQNEKMVVLCVALILKEDFQWEENIFMYKKELDILHQIEETCNYWNFLISDILTIGVERFVYLCRVKPNSVDEKNIVMDSPLHWLEFILTPLLKEKYRIITKPSLFLKSGGKRTIIEFKAK